MTLYEFNAMSLKEREIAAMNGEFLATRTEEGQTVALYGVSSFYVEVWYDNIENEITMFNAFRSLSRLVPYLSDIRIDLKY